MPICFDELYHVEPTAMARRLLWHAFSIGRVWRDESETHPARDKAGVFLFWVVSGRGELHLPEKRWELNAGPQCWLLDMAVSRTYVPKPRQRLVTAGVRFSGAAIDAWRETIGAGAFVLSRTDRKFVRREHRQMLRQVVRRPANFEWNLHESLNRILGRLLAERHVLSAQSETPTPPAVSRVLDAVLAEPLRAWRAAQLADIGGVSYSTLRAQFRRSQQESLSELLVRVRLDQARLLLADDRLAVKQVAAQMDFSSEFYFSQWFRRQTGMSPTAFRDSSRD